MGEETKISTEFEIQERNAEWDSPVRILHWLLVITVMFQLFSSLIMADSSTQFLYLFHELVGLAAGLCVVVFWLYAYAVREFDILFPWNRTGVRAAAGELRGLLRGQLPKTGRQIGLSGFVHGLGLLALTGSGITGLILSTLTPMGSRASLTDAVEFTNMSLTHKFFGEIFWIYCIGHITFALLHQFSGVNVLRGIFRFTDTVSPAAHEEDS